MCFYGWTILCLKGALVYCVGRGTDLRLCVRVSMCMVVHIVKWMSGALYVVHTYGCNVLCILLCNVSRMHTWTKVTIVVCPGRKQQTRLHSRMTTPELKTLRDLIYLNDGTLGLLYWNAKPPDLGINLGLFGTVADTTYCWIAELYTHYLEEWGKKNWPNLKMLVEPSSYRTAFRLRQKKKWTQETIHTVRLLA